MHASERLPRFNHLASSDVIQFSANASAAFLNLQSAFLNLQPRHGEDGAARFNLLFSHLYPQLSPAERHRAEAFVDALMADLERRAVPEHVADVC